MIRTLMTLSIVTLLLTACSRPSYINVPSDDRDTAINGPNWVTTKQIQKAAIAYLLTQDPIPGDLVLKLPQGTSEATAFEVAADLSAYNVFPEGQAPSDEVQVLEVRKIVARGSLGRVDIIRPGTIRQRELIEVHLQWSAWEGWQPEYLRVRNIDVDRIDPLLLAAPPAPPKQPAYEEVQPPAEEPAEDTAAPVEEPAEEAAE